MVCVLVMDIIVAQRYHSLGEFIGYGCKRKYKKTYI